MSEEMQRKSLLSVYLQPSDTGWNWYVFWSHDEALRYPVSDGQCEDYLESAIMAQRALKALERGDVARALGG